MREDHEELKPCDFCETNFTNNDKSAEWCFKCVLSDKNFMIKGYLNAHVREDHEELKPYNLCDTDLKIMVLWMLMWDKNMKNWNHATFIRLTLKIMFVWMLMWDKTMKNWNLATFVTQTLQIMVSWMLMWEKSTKLIVTIVIQILDIYMNMKDFECDLCDDIVKIISSMYLCIVEMTALSLNVRENALQWR